MGYAAPLSNLEPKTVKEKNFCTDAKFLPIQKKLFQTPKVNKYLSSLNTAVFLVSY